MFCSVTENATEYKLIIMLLVLQLDLVSF